ncbi:uncharacterized protein LOC117168875 isoform X2 [Belonocnema kinseyi]|uniref:uncharacterized protein LOC117168875 isoform X2 n=1 Tax=Belonocnema kinseyi TaxID=2817044 RepID=UPI00143D7CE4|nr:uncharacterized protein LOC117168875 isoform X2 [Belonocnema kinseyi]
MKDNEDQMDTADNFEDIERFERCDLTQGTVNDGSETFAHYESSGEGNVNPVHALMDEIDFIENEVTPLVEDETEELDDFFMDVIDDEDCYKDTIDDDHPSINKEEDDAEHLSRKDFTAFEGAISSEAFQRPIDISVNKTVGEVILIILKFVLVHSLSLTAITDSFNMINFLFPEPFLPNSRYLRDKLFYPKNCTKLYGSCSKSGAYVGMFQRNDSFKKCKIFGAKIDLKGCACNDFFVIMYVASPISKLIGTNSDYYDYVVNHRIYQNGIFRDVYDGRKYQKFLSKLSESDRHRYVTMVFNTDGAPLLKVHLTQFGLSF